MRCVQCISASMPFLRRVFYMFPSCFSCLDGLSGTLSNKYHGARKSPATGPFGVNLSPELDHSSAVPWWGNQESGRLCCFHGDEVFVGLCGHATLERGCRSRLRLYATRVLIIPHEKRRSGLCVSYTQLCLHSLFVGVAMQAQTVSCWFVDGQTLQQVWVSFGE